MANLDKIVEEVSGLTALELSDLVKKIEEKFEVSAAMPAMAGPAAAGGAGAAEEVAEEKSAFSVELKNAGGQKIQVIKVLREVLGLGLKEAKDLADAAPKVVKEGMEKAAADELKAKLEAAGAVVDLK